MSNADSQPEQPIIIHGSSVVPENLDELLDQLQEIEPTGPTTPRQGRHGGQSRIGVGINSRQHRCIYFGSAELISRAETAMRVHRSNLSRVIRQLLEIFVAEYEKDPTKSSVEVKGRVDL